MNIIILNKYTQFLNRLFNSADWKITKLLQLHESAVYINKYKIIAIKCTLTSYLQKNKDNSLINN